MKISLLWEKINFKEPQFMATLPKAIVLHLHKHLSCNSKNNPIVWNIVLGVKLLNLLMLTERIVCGQRGTSLVRFIFFKYERNIISTMQNAHLRGQKASNKYNKNQSELNGRHPSNPYTNPKHTCPQKHPWMKPTKKTNQTLSRNI